MVEIGSEKSRNIEKRKAICGREYGRAPPGGGILQEIMPGKDNLDKRGKNMQKHIDL